MANVSLTEKELNSLTEFYDKLHMIAAESAKSQQVFKKFRDTMARIIDKNLQTLDSAIVGRRVLINDRDQNEILSIIGFKREDVEKVYSESTYYSVKFGKNLMIKDQLIYTIPFLLYSLELYKINKKQEAYYVYFTTFIKAYASKVVSSFPIWNDGNDDIMAYIVEKILSNKFDIKKCGTIIATLERSANSSFTNYLPLLSGEKKDAIIVDENGHETVKQIQAGPTDNNLYITVSSGIYSRTSSWIKSVAKIYYDPKNRENFLQYEKSSMISTDDDSEGTSFSVEVESMAAIKQDVIRKALHRIYTYPIEDQLLRIAIKLSYKVPNPDSSLYFGEVKSILKIIIDQCKKDLQRYFENILGSFFFGLNDKGEQRTSKDLKGPALLAFAKTTFNSPHTNDKNILMARETTKKWLSELSDYYTSHNNEKTRRLFMNAVFYYFVLVIQKAA